VKDVSVRVLIADDQAVVRHGIRRVLETRGYEVCGEAADGYEAVQLVRKCKPDVLVLDIVMPAMDGLDAAREIRREHPDLPIVLLSIYSFEAQRIAAMALGIRGIVSKSRTSFDLTEAIEKVSRGQPYFAP
jgi:DNA-binding NarL/FixJ family response regulator